MGVFFGNNMEKIIYQNDKENFLITEIISAVYGNPKSVSQRTIWDDYEVLVVSKIDMRSQISRDMSILVPNE